MKLNVRKIDTILNNPNHNIILKSISALHIVKSHPFYTDKKYSLGFLFNKIITILFYRNLKYLNYITKNIFFSKKNKISKKKILIISHCVNKEQIGKKNDFYFGHLERILKEKNKSYFKILINHTKYDSNYLNSLNKNKNQIILENYLNFSNEIKKKILKIFTAFNLIKLNLNKEINFLMFKKLILSLFNSQTAFSIRIHYQIQNYIKRFDPEYLILTYEGFSWERMCINGAKKQNKKIKCIGYQHSIITDNHHAIYKDIKGNFNPDYIWSSHISSYNLLKKFLNTKKNKIHFIGNFQKVNLKSRKFNYHNTFLVIPEGIYSECKILFQFTYNCAKKFKKFKFIWRVHPVINLKIVLEMLNLKKNEIPKNIIISKNVIDADIDIASFVIYRGSAAVLKATMKGNYPIYYNSTGLNFDPLKSFFRKKNYVNNENEFICLLKKIKKSNMNTSKKIQLIKKDFYVKADRKKINNVLQGNIT